MLFEREWKNHVLKYGKSERYGFVGSLVCRSPLFVCVS